MNSKAGKGPEGGGLTPGPSPAWLTERVAWAIVVAIAVVGLVPRLLHLGDSFLGDALSTLYLVDGQSFGDVISSVSSDAEISPPLYFVLGWAFSQLGSGAELIRLPSLVAGVAVIPLIYMVGARTLSRQAGLIAAAAIALNPVAVFYSTDARAYLIAIALLLGTTLTMLIALETGRRRWWVGYAVLTALCMYAHYTAAFVLAGQLLWLFWAHPEARRTAIVANAGAVALFAPWIPSMLADLDSPTIEVLSLLQGDGFAAKREAVESWAFGYPYNLVSGIPGRLWVTLGSLVLLLGAIASVWRWAAPRVRGAADRLPPVSRGVVLVVVLTLATPVAELVLLGLGGSDLFGARNLNTATPGFALSIGAIATGAGALIGALVVAVVLGAFAVGTVRSLDPNISTIEFESAAAFVDERAGTEDVVVDLIPISPVPLTALDVYLPQPRREFRLYLPEGPPPFLDFPPPAEPLLREALRAAKGHRLFLVAGDTITQEGDDGLTVILPPADPDRDVTETVRIPPSWRITDRGVWDGIVDVEVLQLEQDPAAAR